MNASSNLGLVQLALGRIARDRSLTPVLENLLFEIADAAIYAEIAEARNVSINTIKTESRILLAALGLRSRREIESAAEAARLRADAGADEDDLYKFLRLRFE